METYAESLQIANIDRSELYTMATSESDASNPIPAHVLPYIDEHVHRLVLTDSVRDYHGILCSSCKVPIRSGWIYACLPCKFAVHKTCPEEVLPRPSIWLPKSKIFEKTEVKITGLKAQELVSRGSYEQCLRCGELCAGTIKCHCSKGFSCHESCSLLPAEIQHPFHTHKLVLGFPCPPLRHPSFYPSEYCYACRSKLRQFSSNRLCEVYQCTLCSDFYIHIECAQQMPMLKHTAHEHPLILVRIKQEVANRYNDIKCNWCDQGWPEVPANIGVYRCVPCNFSIHETCIKYQKIMINDDEHHHPLQYIPPEAQDIPGGVYEWSPGDYCETCARDIIQKEPLFKCLECPNEFLFHRNCAFASPQEVSEKNPDDSLLQFREICESFAKEKCNAPFPSLLLLVEQKSESMGKIESLTLDLEDDIRILTALKFIRNR